MASLTLLMNDYLALSKEAGRRHADVREAAEKAHQLLKLDKDQALLQLRAEPAPTPQPLYHPIFLASTTRNAKVIALAVSALQRLITAGAVTSDLVKPILETLEQVIPQGVEIQLKILQTLVGLLTTNVGGNRPNSQERLLQGEQLAQALDLSHRLSTSKIPVVASTASATLRQLFMFVFERVADEDSLVAKSTDPTALPIASFSVDIPAPEHDASVSADSAAPPTEPTSIKLRPAAKDAYLLLEDLCLLVAGVGDTSGTMEGEPSLLQWGTLSRTFGLELVESIVSGFGPIVRSHPELLLVLRAHLCPLLIRFLSSPPSTTLSSSSAPPQFSFPLTLRLARIVFLLLKQFSDLLPLESEVFLSMFIRVIAPGDKGEGEGGHPNRQGASSPLWMRVLALEIFRGLCGDFTLMIKFYERYDAVKAVTKEGTSVFRDLMSALSRLATERPSVLGVGAAITYGTSLGPIPSTSGTAASMLEGAVEMGIGFAQVATNAVGNAVVAGGPSPGLSIATASMKLQCIDQLDKAEAPPIPETYIFLLALQCLNSLSDGFASYTLSAYSVILSSRPRSTTESSSPAALDWSTLDKADAKVASLLVVKDMAETSWPALLASLSFYIATALDEDLFHDVVSALQNFTSVCGVLSLTTPREAFITSLCKFAIPAAVVAHLTALEANGPIRVNMSVLSAGVDSLGLGPAAPLPVGLSTRNYACLKALLSVAQYLAGSLDSIWFTVFETLQNADLVLRAQSSKKPTSSTPPPTTTPTEADEVAIQNSITKLFQVSKTLDDEAFKWFIGALCRLNGEMIGFTMALDGKMVESTSTPLTGMMSPLEGPSRRRASGVSTLRTLRQGERSFGLSKLGVVSLLNVERLTNRDPSVGWDIVTSHLLLVLHHELAPPAIRLQAADVLDQLLLVAPRTSSADQPNRRNQTQILQTLASQAEPESRLQSTTDVDLRRMALDALFKILETNGHSFVTGWEQIFDILRTACPSPLAFAPPSPAPPSSLESISEGQLSSRRSPTAFDFGSGSRSPVLVRTSFPSLQLICTDFLEGLTIDELRVCISTLAEFGKQGDDVNVALTAGGLLWSVSDHLQAKRTDGENEVAHGELWMFLLHQLLASCKDPRQEVRDGAISTVFRSISTYGTTLSKATWDACMWEITFPLVDALSSALATHATTRQVDGEQLVVQINGPPIRLIEKQWDDSKVLALTSLGNVFLDYWSSKLIKTPRYEETWSNFVGLLKKSFVEDRPQVATSAMKAFERVLKVSLDGVEEEGRIASSWEVAWIAWEEIGHSIASGTKSFTQINLESYVRVALPIYSTDKVIFDLARIRRLLSILKDVLTFSSSPDYRPDIDTLTPVQASILEVLAAIKLELPGAASAVLTDLAEYLTLAFIAAFDSEVEMPGRGGKPVQRVSYIALSKEVMPHVLWLFQRFKDDASIYEQGAVERMFAAYALPMKLKHDCPSPSKYGDDELLWKTATINFLRAVRDCVLAMDKFSDQISTVNFEGIWRQIIEGYRGVLLADVTTTTQFAEERLLEENFDLAVLVSLEKDLMPHLGAKRVPDDLIKRLGRYLQTASRLYTLNLPPRDLQSEATTNGGAKESRFDDDFDRQAKGRVYGTTAEVVEAGRERFAYWCFETLFAWVSATDQDHSTERKRIATLCLPSLLNRCAATIKTYVADAPLRGKMPFPRVRQEELIFVLQRLLNLRLGEGTLSTALESSSTIDTTLPLPLLIRSLLLRSSLGHLYELHPLFTSLISLSTHSPSITSAYIPSRRHAAIKDSDNITFRGLPDGFIVGKIGRAGSGMEESDVVQLVLRILEKLGEEIGSSRQD